MIATPVPILLHAPQEAPRSPGVHVSSVIRNIAIENKILKAEWVDDLSLVDLDQGAWWAHLSHGNQVRIAMGLAWEQWYIPQLQDVADHPGEMELDGIYMTHDGESLDMVVSNHAPSIWVPSIHEVKLTYKSTKTVGDLSSQWLWLAQTKAYCKGLGTRIAFVHVNFACGDYSYPITPQLKCWRVEYTQAEIDDNWELITSYVRHRQQMEREEEWGGTS